MVDYYTRESTSDMQMQQVPSYGAIPTTATDMSGFYAPPPEMVKETTSEEPGYDPDDYVEDSLYRGRRKTDTRVSLLFTSCLTLFIALMAKLLWTHASDVGSLGHARNYQGLACGYDAPVAALPLLFVPIDPADGKALRLLANRAMCVSRCPDQTDVGAKAYLDVPEVALMQDKSKSTMMSLLHSVRSPVYASRPFAGAICFPEHKGLAEQVQEVFESHLYLSGLRLVAGGLWMAAPLLVGSLLLCIGVTWLTLLLMKGNGNILLVFWLAAAALASFLHGSHLLVTATAGFSQLENQIPWLYLVAPQQRNCILVGIGLVLISLTIVGWTLSNWRLLSESLKLLETVRLLIPAIPAATGLNLLFQLTAAFTAFLGLFGFLMIQSKLDLADTPAAMSLNPNGGLRISPLERPSHSTWNTLWSTLVLLVACVWILEALSTLTKYAALYTGVVWYFSPIDHLGQRRTSANLPLFGLMLGLDSHLGSVALFSWFAWLSRPLRVLFLSSAPRISETENPHLAEEEREPAVRGEGLAQRFSDIVHNGVICETVSSSRGIWPSFKITRRRVHRSLAAASSIQAAAAAAISLSSLISWSVICGVTMTTFAITSSVLMDLTSVQHQAPSALYFSTPFMSAAIIAVIVAYVASIPLTALAALIDSLLYCVILERDKKETGDLLSIRPGFAGDNRAGSMQCPEVLQDRLESMAQQDDFRMSTTSDD